MILSEKYRPLDKRDWVGPKYAVNLVTQHLGFFKAGRPVFKCILLVGTRGTGKTTLAHMAANELGFNVVEINASDERKKNDVSRLWKSAMARTIENKPNLIVIDEGDGLTKTMQKRIARLVASTASPIIICANYDYKIVKELKKVSLAIKFEQPQDSHILELLSKVAQLEGATIPKSVLKEIAFKCTDYRSALGMLSMVMVNDSMEGLVADGETGDISTQISQTLAGKPPERYGADPGTIEKWLVENTHDIDLVAMADVQLARVQPNQNYKFWRYAYGILECCREQRGEQLRGPGYSMRPLPKAKAAKPKDKSKKQSPKPRPPAQKSNIKSLTDWF